MVEALKEPLEDDLGISVVKHTGAEDEIKGLLARELMGISFQQERLW